MDPRVENFVSGFFREDMRDGWGDTRRSLTNSSDEYRDTIRAGLAAILRDRPYSADDWYRLTALDVSTVDEVYTDIAAGYEYLFPE